MYAFEKKNRYKVENFESDNSFVPSCKKVATNRTKIQICRHPKRDKKEWGDDNDKTMRSTAVVVKTALIVIQM